MHVLDFYQALIQKKIPIIVDSHQLNAYLKERGYQTILWNSTSQLDLIHPPQLDWMANLRQALLVCRIPRRYDTL